MCRLHQTEQGQADLLIPSLTSLDLIAEKNVLVSIKAKLEIQIFKENK